MRKLYPILSRTLLFISIGLLSFISVNAQNCGPVVENFNLAGGTNGGFTSSIHMNPNPATGLVFGFTGQDAYLQRCGATAGTVYEVVSPYYQSSPTATTLGVGFKLSGAVPVSQVGIFIEYLNSNTGTITTAFATNVTPVYTGPAGNQTALICTEFPMTSLAGFTPGTVYRVHILLTAGATGNANQCLVFDDFRTTGVLSPTAINQTPTCGPVAENFNNTGGSTAGFTSFIQGNPTSAGFTFANTGTNGYLQRCNITGGVTYQIHSPTYQTAVSQNYIGYGFELTGAALISNVSIFVEYLSPTGAITTAYIGSHTPVYTGTGNNTVARICDSVLISNIPGFTPGGRYRIYVLLTAGSSSNSGQCVVFDNFRTTGFQSQIILPVTFAQFIGRVANQSAILYWSVAGEKDVSKYEVERSSNGVDFIKVGEVPASGLSTYTYTDANLQQGVYFYRVRNIDLDGQFKYSTVVRLNLSKVITIKAFPQPAFNQLTIEHNKVENSGKISLINGNGQVVREIDVKPNLTQTTVNLSGMSSGMYILHFDNGNGQVETIKVVKQ
jgi:hypothetical protein